MQTNKKLLLKKKTQKLIRKYLNIDVFLSKEVIIVKRHSGQKINFRFNLKLKLGEKNDENNIISVILKRKKKIFLQEKTNLVALKFIQLRKVSIFELI